MTAAKTTKSVTPTVAVEQAIARGQWSDERIAAEVNESLAFVADVRRGMNEACCADVVTPRRRDDRTKRCSECDEVKPVSAFARDDSRTDGLTYRCRDCRNAGDRRAYSPAAAS